MAEFSKGVRKWWMRVAAYCDGTEVPMDQTLVYDEERGFHRTGEVAREVHHVIPGSYAEEYLGQRANDQVGLPVSSRSHNGGGTTLPYCRVSTFHIDIDQARKDYAHGKKDAFKKSSERRRKLARRGKRTWGGDEGSDRVYTEIMEEKAVQYIAATGDRKPESGKPIPRRRHWSDGLFD